MAQARITSITNYINDNEGMKIVALTTARDSVKGGYPSNTKDGSVFSETLKAIKPKGGSRKRVRRKIYTRRK